MAVETSSLPQHVRGTAKSRESVPEGEAEILKTGNEVGSLRNFVVASLQLF